MCVRRPFVALTCAPRASLQKPGDVTQASVSALSLAERHLQAVSQHPEDFSAKQQRDAAAVVQMLRRAGAT